MAAETELEKLVVRLVGDASNYQKMLNEAVASTQELTKALEDQSAKTEKTSASMTSFASTALKALASFGAVSWLKDSFKGYSAMEAGQLKLRAAIEANGGSVKQVETDYRKFAEAIKNTTKYSAGDTLVMLQKAEAYGLSGDAAKAAVKNAISLGAATGQEAEGFLRTTVALTRGNVELLRRIPGLRGIKDNTELLAKAHKMLASGMKIAQAEGNTTSTQIEKLSKSISGMKKEFGAVVEQAIRPVVGWLKQAVGWMRGLSVGSKTAIVAFMAITAAVVSLGPALAAVGAALGVLFSPVVIAVGIVSVLLGRWIDELGGVEQAWKVVKEAAVAAWDWLEPVRDAFSSLMSTVWEVAKEAWTSIRDLAKSAWDSISVSGAVNWEMIREGIVTALLAGEFAIRNFKQICDFVWTAIAYGFIVFANQVEFFFRQVMPAVGEWFATNWKDIFTDVWNWTKTVFVNLASNIGSIVSQLPEIIKGNISIDTLWTPLTEGFKRKSKELVLPERTAGELEKHLQKEFQDKGAALGVSFEEFRKKKMEEFEYDKLFPEDEKSALQDDALNVGKGIGANFQKGAADEIQKFDAAVRGSSEALQRIQAYQNLLVYGKKEKKGGEGVKRFDAASGSSSEGLTGQDENTKVLKDIRDTLKEKNRASNVEFEDADL